MRILALDFRGFGPFRDRQVLNLSEAAGHGILLIAGRTGAGKSSILDAVCFALYGAVPRYDGQPGRVRSDHLPPTAHTEVTLDFAVAAGQFRVRRTPEWQRPKKRGDGTTSEKATAQLWRWNTDTHEWEGVAARPVDVAAELQLVLGLSLQQFLQVVLLAQGGFQRFLRADDQERQATLRTLFQSERFAEMEREFGVRRSAQETIVERQDALITSLMDQLEADSTRDRELWTTDDATDDEVNAEGDASAAGDTTAALAPVSSAPMSLEERRARIAAVLEQGERVGESLKHAAAEAADRREAADTAAQTARITAAAQLRRGALTEREHELDAERPTRVAERVELRAAERAASVRGAVEAAQTALTATQIARQEVAEAEDVIRTHRQAPEAAPKAASGEGDPAHFEDRLAVLTAERNAIADSLAVVRESRHADVALQAARDRLRQLRRDLAAESEQSQQLEERFLQLPEEIERVRAEYEVVADLAAGREVATAMEAAAARVVAETERLAALRPQYDQAVLLTADRADAAAVAAETVRDVLRRRVSGMAGELASQLRPGEPCVVCGAREHPLPAEHSDPVDEATVVAAEQEQGAAQQLLDQARQSDRDIESAVTAAASTALASIAAAEISVEEWDRAASAARQGELGIRQLRIARERVRVASDAQVQLVSTQERRTALEDERSQLTAARTRSAAQLAQLRAETTHAAAAVTELETEVHRAAGEYPSVADRLRAGETELAAWERAITVIQNLVQAMERLELAQADRDTALTLAEFADSDAVARVARSDAQIDALRERVEQFAAEEHRIAGALAAPELRGLPAAQIAVEPFEAALREAHARHTDLVSRGAALADRIHERRSQLARLTAELAGAADALTELRELRALADTVQGKDPNTRRMRLEVFVLAARLEAIIEAANRRLSRMVGGRYRLQHDDGLRSRGRQSGLGISVFDDYTGRERSTASLSGGETFLASLALALGLADVVTAEAGGVRLDTLFIDEGFGTLDPDALEQALAVLDALREGGRTVALISHVAELRDRLPAMLEVLVDDRGISQLRGAGAEPSHATDARTHIPH